MRNFNSKALQALPAMIHGKEAILAEPFAVARVHLDDVKVQLISSSSLAQQLKRTDCQALEA